ncbi:MAG TPA: PAS domain S-box protein, partial [Gemmatimonadaceae bacterium]
MTPDESSRHEFTHPQTGVLAESAPDPIVTIDESSTILYANASAQRVFGYSIEEMVGSSLLLLMPERMQALHSHGIARYVATGERSISWQGIRVPIRTKSGVEIPVEISFGEFESNGKRLFSGFLRDISERVASDSTLAAANERLFEQAAELEQQFEEALLLSEELSGRTEEAESRLLQADRASDRARRLLELTSGLNRAVGVSEVANLILDIGMPAVGADAGSFSIITDANGSGSQFEIISIRGFEEQITSRFVRFPLHAGRPISDAVLQGAP